MDYEGRLQWLLDSAARLAAGRAPRGHRDRALSLMVSGAQALVNAGPDAGRYGVYAQVAADLREAAEMLEAME